MFREDHSSLHIERTSRTTGVFTSTRGGSNQVFLQAVGTLEETSAPLPQHPLNLLKLPTPPKKEDVFYSIFL